MMKYNTYNMRFTGNCSSTNVSKLHKCILDAAKKSNSIAIDLSSVVQADMAFLQMLCYVADEMCAQDCTLSLYAPSNAVLCLLERVPTTAICKDDIPFQHMDNHDTHNKFVNWIKSCCCKNIRV